jgi:hypothetical protein
LIAETGWASKYVYVVEQVVFNLYDHIANHCPSVLGPGQIRRASLAGNPRKAASTGKLILLLIGQLFSTSTRLRKEPRTSYCNNGPNIGKNHRNMYSFAFSCVVLKI